MSTYNGWKSQKQIVVDYLETCCSAVAEKKVSKIHIDGPLDVRGRNSNNDLIRKKLDWDYQMTLKEGIRYTYYWIQEQIGE